MSPPLRLAGRGDLPDGSSVTWTISEGRRGRRWREVVAAGESVQHVLLLETGPSGRFAHVELASAAGLWTFHPEDDGTLHGNHVDARGSGVRHVLGWSFGPEDLLLIEGSPIAAAATAWWLAASVPASGSTTRAAVRVDPAGPIEAVETVLVERTSAGRWRLAGGGPFEIDPRGVPVLANGVVTPLELDR